MNFELSKEQQEKFNNWRDEQKKSLEGATIGGAYTFCFTPTSIGLFIEVQCVNGQKLDLTEEL